jgi:pyruvate dehydrogenase E1 component alpha subunit
MHGERVDGRDVLQVRNTVCSLRSRVLEQGEPAILEAVSYRFRGHSVIDPARYRPSEEVAREQADDPLQRYAQYLRDKGIVDDGWFAHIDEAIVQQVNEAIEYAETSPFPAVEDLYLNTYATPVANMPA